MLSGYGSRRPTSRGELLIVEGRPDEAFIVVLSGRVAIVKAFGTPEQQIVRVHGPGRFLGELGLLTGQVAFFTAIVLDPGEVLEVPTDRLRECLLRDPAFGDEILRAYLIRRTLAIGEGHGFRIVGSRFSADTRRLREFAARNRLPHRFVDLESDADAESLLRALGITPAETPVVVWRDKVLRNPDPAELAALIGQRAARPPSQLNDLVVVGAGPAGLAAAVYGASEGLRTQVLDAVATGGQAATTSRIENYLGFPAGISGGRAGRAGRGAGREVRGHHAARLPRRSRWTTSGGQHVVRLRGGDTLTTRTLVIATGARYRRLPVPRLEEFEQTSVYYAATQVEAQLCVERPGGGGGRRELGRPGRRCSSPTTPARSSWWCASTASTSSCRATWPTGSCTIRASRCTCTPRCAELVGERGQLEAVVVRGHDDRRPAARCPRASSWCSSGRIRAPAGWPAPVALDSGGYVLHRPGRGAGRRA